MGGSIEGLRVGGIKGEGCSYKAHWVVGACSGGGGVLLQRSLGLRCLCPPAAQPPFATAAGPAGCCVPHHNMALRASLLLPPGLAALMLAPPYLSCAPPCPPPPTYGAALAVSSLHRLSAAAMALCCAPPSPPPPTYGLLCSPRSLPGTDTIAFTASALSLMLVGFRWVGGQGEEGGGAGETLQWAGRVHTRLHHHSSRTNNGMCC